MVSGGGRSQADFSALQGAEKSKSKFKSQKSKVRSQKSEVKVPTLSLNAREGWGTQRQRVGAPGIE